MALGLKIPKPTAGTRASAADRREPDRGGAHGAAERLDRERLRLGAAKGLPRNSTK